VRAPGFLGPLLLLALGALLYWRFHEGAIADKPSSHSTELTVELSRPGSPEQLVTETVAPLERAFATLPHLKRIVSDVRRGAATVYLTFETDDGALQRVSALVPPQATVRDVSAHVRRLYLVIESAGTPRADIARWLGRELIPHLPKGMEVLHTCATDAATFIDLDPAKLGAHGVTAAGVVDALQHQGGPYDAETKVDRVPLGELARVHLGVKPGACILHQRSGASVELALQMGTPVDALDEALKALPAGWHVARFVPEATAEVTFGGDPREPDALLDKVRSIRELASAELELRSVELPGGTSTGRGRLVFALQDEQAQGNALRSLAPLHLDRLDGLTTTEVLVTGDGAATLIQPLMALGPLFGAPPPPLPVARIEAPARAASTVKLIAPPEPNLPAGPDGLPAVANLLGAFNVIEIAPGTPLAAVAMMQLVPEPQRLARANSQPALVLQIAASADAVRARLREVQLPPGVTVVVP
jgi:hypothetical protein